VLHQFPKYVNGVPVVVFVMLAVPSADDSETGVDDRHARFIVYCVKPEALNVLAVSLIFVCTTQTSTEMSTATQKFICTHRFRQSVSEVYGYNFPFSDATSLCLVHVSHPVECQK